MPPPFTSNCERIEMASSNFPVQWVREQFPALRCERQVFVLRQWSRGAGARDCSVQGMRASIKHSPRALGQDEVCPPGSSTVGGLDEASIVGQLGHHLEIARYLDGEVLFGGHAVHPVHGEADREVCRSCVAVRCLGALRTRAVAEVPVIGDCGCPAGIGLCGKIYRLTGLRC